MTINIHKIHSHLLYIFTFTTYSSNPIGILVVGNLDPVPSLRGVARLLASTLDRPLI